MLIRLDLNNASLRTIYRGELGLPKLTAPVPALRRADLGATDVVHAESEEQNP